MAAVAPDASDYAFDLPFLLVPAYYVVAHGRRRTIGEASVGIAVRSAQTFGPLGHPRALGRWLVGLLLWIFVVLGAVDAVSPLWHARNRAWRDLAAGSIVIRL